MRKLMRKLAFVALTIMPSLAQAEVGSIQATIEIIPPLAIAQTSPLDFGTIFSDRTTDVVVATTDGGAAAFTITGHDGTTTDITTETTATLTHTTDGTKTIPIIGINLNNASIVLNGATEVKAGGTADIDNAVGALTVGNYTGSFNVTVVYQ